MEQITKIVLEGENQTLNLSLFSTSPFKDFTAF